MVVFEVPVNGCNPVTIVLGRRGTYNTQEVTFDLSYLVENYGAGTAVLMVKRSQDTSAYPAVVSQESNTLTWGVSDVDTFYPGSGECELMWYVDEGLAKTIIYPMVVMRDILQTTEEPPDGYENWIEHLTELGAETQQNAQDAAQSASKAKASEDSAAESAQRAKDAAGLLVDVSATATTLDPGQPATAEYNDGVFKFGIPKGDKLTYADLTEADKEDLVQGPIKDAQDDAVEAVGTAKTNAVDAVNQAGTTQKNAVNQAGTTQKNAVTQEGTTQVNTVREAGTTQVGRVTTEGNTQVGRVQDKGDEVIASIPSDYSDLTAEVDDLSRQLSNQMEPNYMVELQKGSSTNTSGPLMPFRIHVGDSVTVTSKDSSNFVNCQFRSYNANKQYIDYWGLLAGYGNKRTFTINSEVYYVGITTVDVSSPDYYIAVNNSNAYRQVITAIEEGYKSADIALSNSVDLLNEQSVKKQLINRFDKSKITAGKYININDGYLANNAEFFASDFIYIGDLDTVTVSYTHLFGWYDASKAWIGHPDTMNSRTTDLTFTRPENAAYLRFSSYNDDINKSQVGENISRENYTAYGIYTLPDLRINASQISGDESRIVVDASGGGDYTSFTQAIYETVDSGIDVLVKPGTYDIVAEYVALFGQSAVDSMADADNATFNGFQYGVRLRKRKVEFAPGAHIVCDWTGHTVDGTHRFSALGVDYNVEIIGLDLDVTATFYCIHDDYGIWDSPYTVNYENCRVIGHNIFNANCIGGGCKPYSRHILNNCYFDNNLTGSATVRYHNTNAEGAEPEIYVSNCYFNNWFTPRWYGTQTTKMKVYVNNCEARAIYKMAESSSYNVDNVELYKWCNTETAPQS